MVRPYAFPFWSRNFSAGVADRALSDVWRNINRRAFLHGSRADRTKVRHRSSTSPGDVSGFSPAARARVFALLHLAPFQTDTAGRHPCARTFARRYQGWPRVAAADFLEL